MVFNWYIIFNAVACTFSFCVNMRTTYPVKLFLEYSPKRSQRSTNENLCFDLIIPFSILYCWHFLIPCFDQTICLNQNWYKKWRPSRFFREVNQGLQYITFISKACDSSSNLWPLGSVSSVFYQWLLWFSGNHWKHVYQKKFSWTTKLLLFNSTQTNWSFRLVSLVYPRLCQPCLGCLSTRLLF